MLNNHILRTWYEVRLDSKNKHAQFILFVETDLDLDPNSREHDPGEFEDFAHDALELAPPGAAVQIVSIRQPARTPGLAGSAHTRYPG